MNTYSCFHCSEEERFTNNCPRKVLDHITKSHLQKTSEDHNILPKFPCILTNCKIFRSRSSVLKHIGNPSCILALSRSTRSAAAELVREEVNIVDEHALGGIVNQNGAEVNVNEHFDSLENLENDSTKILNSFSKNLQGFFNFLKCQGVSEGSVNEIVSYQKNMFEHVEIISRGARKNYVYSELKKYKTAYKRKQNFKNHPNFTPVKQYSIKVKPSIRRRKGVTMHFNKQCKFAYIHINKSLEIVFKNESFRKIYEDYNNNNECNDLIMKGFCCGSVFRSSSHFKQNPKAIQVQIFYDDFVVNNPLGNKSNNQKLGGIYFSIKNLPEYFLSKQDHIFLVCLFKVQDLKNRPSLINKILSKIRLDIKHLQKEGILVEGKKNTAQLTSLSYDNLGANTICGMKRSFNANNYCRICKLTKEECWKALSAPSHMIRTGNESKRMLLRNGDKMGLVFHSELNDIPGFNVFDNVTVDPMHDVTEGTIPIVLMIFFKHLSNSNILDFKQIVALILSYDLPSLESKNKVKNINVIEGKKNFGLYACQYKSLIFHIPFIFEKYKDLVNPVIWQLVITQIKITKIVFSYRIPYCIIDNLERLFESFLRSISDLNLHLTPKLHNLTHYTMLIKKMGPVAHYSTFHYEHFHQQFSKFTKTLRCFKNLTTTLAEKYMEIFILKWSESKFIEIEKKGKMNLIKNYELTPYQSIFEKYQNLHFDELNFVNLGFLYKKDLLVVEVVEDNFVFMKIIKVLKHDIHFYLLIRKCETVGYDNNFANYEITFSNEYDLITLASLKIKNSYNYLKSINNKYYVMVQNIICE